MQLYHLTSNDLGPTFYSITVLKRKLNYLQTNPSSSIGLRFDTDEIPNSDFESSALEDEDPDEAAESRMALTVISALFGLVILLIVLAALYFMARD